MASKRLQDLPELLDVADDDIILIADVSNGNLTHRAKAAVLKAEMGTVDVDSVEGLNEALDLKADVDHTHAIADVDGLQEALDGKAASSHTQAISTITGLQAALDSKAAAAHNHDGVYAPIVHDHDGTYAPASHGHSSDDITEGLTNRFFTEERVDDRVAALIKAGTGISVEYNDAANELTITNIGGGEADLSANDTDDLKEGVTNLYYTNERVDSRISAKVGDGTLAAGTHDHDGVYAPVSHTQEISTITGLQSALDAKAEAVHNHDGVYSPIGHNHDLEYAPLVHTQAISSIVGLQAALDAKAAEGHTHVIGNVTGLQAALDSKASTSHTHTTDQVTEGTNKYYTDERVDDRVAALLQAGAGIHIGYDDANNTLTITNIGGGAADLSENDTDDLAEGSTNLYYTDDRVDARIAVLVSNDTLASGDHVHTTSEVEEGVNLYYTDERVDDRVAALLQAGAGIQLTYDDINGSLTITNTGGGSADLSENTTDDLAEGSTNLYYTNERVDSRATVLINNLAAPKAHTHQAAQIEGLSDLLSLKADYLHDHAIADVEGLQLALDGKSDVGHNHDSRYYQRTEVDSALALKADTGHNHDEDYAPLVHSHPVAEVDGLQTILDGKADLAHNHDSVYLPKTGGVLTGLVTGDKGLFVKNSFYAMSGDGLNDLSMTGLYDRDELINVTKRGSVTVTITGSGNQPPQERIDIFFDGTADFGYISGIDETTSKIEIVVDCGELMPNYSHAIWQPFVQFRRPFIASWCFPRKVTVELSQDGEMWYKPLAGEWETTDIAVNAPIPGLWMGIPANPNLPLNLYRYARYTLENFNVANGVLYLTEIGLRHVSAPYTRAYVRTTGDTIYGDLAVTGLVDGVDVSAFKAAYDAHNHDSAYAPLSHGHAIAEVDGLQAALDAKAASDHNHDAAYLAITGGNVTGNLDVSGVLSVGGVAVGTMAFRNVTFSVDDPSGGSAGDIWFKKVS